MVVVSRYYIEKYIQGFSSNPEAQLLLRDALLDNLFKDKQYHKPVRHINDLPSGRLKKKFRKSNNLWYLFTATPNLSRQVTVIAFWLETETERLGSRYDTKLRDAAQAKLRRTKSVEEILALCEGPLLTEAEINQTLSQRQKPEEELSGHTKYIGNLPRDHGLVQIITSKGMINAGRNAKNCLGSMIRPNKDWPHRERVKSPDHWLYFSIRDEHNRSVITVGVDVKKSKISWQGNNEQEISADDHESWDLLTPALEEIRQRFLGNTEPARKNGTTKKPYGAFGTFRPPEHN